MHFKIPIKKGKLAKNALFNSASFAIISIVNFISIPLIVKSIGVEQFGIYILVTSLFGYYGIFDLGLGQGLIKFVSDRLAFNKQEEINLGISSAFWLQFLLGFFVSSLLYHNAVPVAKFMNVGNTYLLQTASIIQFASIGFFFSMISSVFSSVLMGMQAFTITSKVDAINNIFLNIAIIFLLYVLKIKSITSIVLINVLFAIANLFVYIFVVTLKLKFFSFKVKIDFYLLVQFLKFSFHIFLSKISNLFANYIFRFIIGFYAGPSAVTYYTVPSKLLGALGGMLSSASSALMPYISELNAGINYDKIKQTFLRASYIFSAITIPISLVLILFSKPILSIWMGDDFSSNSYLILSIITVSGTIGSFSAIPNQVIIGMGYSKLIGIFSLLTVILYSIFLPLFTKYFLLIGASLGLLITSVSIIVFVLKKTTVYLKIPTVYYLKFVFLPHFLPTALFLALSITILHFCTINRYSELFIALFECIAYYIYLFFYYEKKIISLTI